MIRLMNIGILGSGHIGATAARLFVAAGHHVAISNSRGPETLQDLVAELGSNARAATAEEASRFGEVVLVAIPLKEYRSLDADALRGKIVIDAMNYYPDRDGHFPSLDDGSRASSELVAEHLPESRVVKAFNTIWFQHLATQGDPSKPMNARRAIPVSGDDDAAKGAAISLIESIGFGAVDMGSLRESRNQEPGANVYNKDATVSEIRAILGA